MIIPIRCFTCGKIIADKWETYEERVTNGEPANKVLDELGFERICCRRMFISFRNLIDEINKFE
ncbi:MAG: DNA-directed RNA polymerase subunit N [Candidatus Lokiarchaeota archaeon]|nr:DNA-directed RNA polymerase subunit N [Candidatus Lokiarchaeota archaeon]